MWTTGVTLTSSGPPKGYSVVVLQVGYMNISSEFGRRGCQEGDPNWACWHDNVAKKTGGSWYSTTKEGYGTSWKVAQVVKRVNKTCADNSINNVVEKAGRSVFASLGAKTGTDRNVSSSEWITAWYTTILGPGAAKGVPAKVQQGAPAAALGRHKVREKGNTRIQNKPACTPRCLKWHP